MGKTNKPKVKDESLTIDPDDEEGITEGDVDKVKEQLALATAKNPTSTKVTTIENFSGQIKEDPLPDEDSLSDSQIQTIRGIRNSDIRDIVELIGSDEMENYKITVIRKGPPVFKGHNVTFGKVYESKVPQTWDELEELIFARHGGGSYLVRVMCRKGRSRKSHTLHFEGAPKLEENECPQLFEEVIDPAASTTPHEPEVLSRSSLLQEEISVAALQRQLRNIQGEPTTPQADDRRMDLLEGKIDQLAESLKKKPESIPWALIIPAAITFMTTNRTSSLESQRIAADRDKETNNRMLEIAMKQNQPVADNSLDNFTTIYQLMQSGNKNTMDVFNALLPHMLGNDIDTNPMLETFKMMGGMFDKGLEAFKTAAEVKRLRELKERRRGALPEAGKPAAEQEAAAAAQPAAGGSSTSTDSNPIEQYIAGDTKKKFPLIFFHLLRDAENMTDASEAMFPRLVVLEQSPHQVVDWFLTLKNVEEFKLRVSEWPDKEVYKIFNNKIFEDSERYLWLTRCIRYLQNYFRVQYASFDGMEDKIRCVLVHLVRESEGMRGPEDTLFCSLILSDETPVELTAFIIASESAAGLRKNLAQVVEGEDLVRLDENLFSNGDKCEWMDECIEYISSMFSEDDFDEPADPTPVEIVDEHPPEAAEGDPDDDGGVSPFEDPQGPEVGVDIEGQSPIVPVPIKKKSAAKKRAPAKKRKASAENPPARKKKVAKKKLVKKVSAKKKRVKKKPAKKKAAPKKKVSTKKKKSSRKR